MIKLQILHIFLKNQVLLTKTKTIFMKRNGSELDYYVPMSEDNSDYQSILEWVAEGNTVEPADE